MSSNRQSTAPKKAPATRENAGAQTILIVEDETSIRTLMARFLGMNGFRVLAAEDPRAALLLWEDHADEVDLLLTDVIMPGALSGRALADRLHASRPDLKVLYTSGYTAESLNADGLLEMDICFLQKPYRPDQLLDAVRAMLAGTFHQNQNHQNQNRYVETTAC